MDSLAADSIPSPRSRPRLTERWRALTPPTREAFVRWCGRVEMAQPRGGESLDPDLDALFWPPDAQPLRRPAAWAARALLVGGHASAGHEALRRALVCAPPHARDPRAVHRPGGRGARRRGKEREGASAARPARRGRSPSPSAAGGGSRGRDRAGGPRAARRVRSPRGTAPSRP